MQPNEGNLVWGYTYADLKPRHATFRCNLKRPITIFSSSHIITKYVIERKQIQNLICDSSKKSNLQTLINIMSEKDGK